MSLSVIDINEKCLVMKQAVIWFDKKIILTHHYLIIFTSRLFLYFPAYGAQHSHFIGTQVVLVGESGVGKSSLIQQFTQVSDTNTDRDQHYLCTCLSYLDFRNSSTLQLFCHIVHTVCSGCISAGPTCNNRSVQTLYFPLAEGIFYIFTVAQVEFHFYQELSLPCMRWRLRERR